MSLKVKPRQTLSKGLPLRVHGVRKVRNFTHPLKCLINRGQEYYICTKTIMSSGIEARRRHTEAREAHFFAKESSSTHRFSVWQTVPMNWKPVGQTWYLCAKVSLEASIGQNKEYCRKISGHLAWVILTIIKNTLLTLWGPHPWVVLLRPALGSSEIKMSQTLL